MGGLSLAGGGWTMNLMVYLIEEFNVKSIDAAQIFNIVNGCTALFPILGAIIADSFLGCFSVIWISSLFSLLVSVYISIYIHHIKIAGSDLVIPFYYNFVTTTFIKFNLVLFLKKILFIHAKLTQWQLGS